MSDDEVEKVTVEADRYRKHKIRLWDYIRSSVVRRLFPNATKRMVFAKSVCLLSSGIVQQRGLKSNVGEISVNSCLFTV